MVNRPFDDGGSIGDLPWASVFDPAANARSLNAIQAEGFRAASLLVDKFARIAKTDEAGPSATTPSTTTATEPAAGVGPVLEQMTRAWWSAAGHLLLGSLPRGRPPAGELDLSGRDRAEGVILESCAPGRAATEVWLHNRGTEDFGEVRLLCSDLLSHEGHVIARAMASIRPSVVPMPARSSRGIAVEVLVAVDMAAGVYRGNLLISGHVDSWLPVVLTISSPAP